IRRRRIAVVTGTRACWHSGAPWRSTSVFNISSGAIGACENRPFHFSVRQGPTPIIHVADKRNLNAKAMPLDFDRMLNVFVIDCYGHEYVEEHVVCVDDTLYVFVFTESLKSSYETFDLGLFMDQHAHSSAVWKYPREQRAAALLESSINRCYQNPRSLERRFPI